jgi:pyruvate dehydrogenase E1 component alpha subunit
MEEGILTDAEAAAMDVEARAEAEAALLFAEKNPFPTEADILRNVYSELDEPTSPNVPRGTFFFN